MSSTKSFPKSSRIINCLFTEIKWLTLNSRLWMWAAVHSNDFKHLEIGITKTIHFSSSTFPYGGRIFSIEINLYKPFFYYFLPSTLEEDFCEEHGLPQHTFSDGIPF